MKKAPALLLCLLLLAATACKHSQRQSDVLDDQTMIGFLTDLYLVEGYYAVETQYRYDSSSPEITEACDAILEKYNITRESVEKSLDYYSQHPDEYKPIETEVASRLERLNEPAEEGPLP